jgi:hypothetical protein
MSKTRFRTVTLTEKQRQKMAVRASYHEGFSAACDALLHVFGAKKHAHIQDIISAVDHVQGHPPMLRQLRRELRRERAGKEVQ